jgi:NADH dehydrogenase
MKSVIYPKMPTMRHESILVIGGSGFIGSHIVAQLAATGRRVIVPTRRHHRARHLTVLPTVQLVEADVYDPLVLDRLMRHADAVINLVGVLHSSGGTPWGPAFERAHVELPRRLVAACQRQGLKRFLHMSALGADEHGPSMYQRSKAAGEKIMVEARGLELTSFRPSVVFGPEDNFLNMFAQLQSVLPVLALGGVQTKFQPVFVGDVAQAFVQALENVDTIGQTYELVGTTVYSMKELLHLAGVYSGHPRPVIELPDALARIQAFLLEHMPGGPIMSRDNLDSMKVDNVATGLHSTPPAWQATPLEAVAPRYLAPH